MRNFASFRVWILLIASLAASLSSNADSGTELLAQFPRSQLKVATPDARLHNFNVWIAADAPHREQGLMYVKSLPDDAAMLFIYPAPQPISMWMKNTFIPLDMLFIRADGRVARVVANTKPHSLATIESGENVLAVLELKGGTAAKLNIRPGAVVMHEMFRTLKR
jgi:uncharacterized membrane protein (UPF0127 family)